MADILKVSVLEKDGEEYNLPVEALFSIQNVHNQDPSSTTLKGQDLVEVIDWARTNTMYKRNFMSENISVPIGYVIQMHSPIIDGEVFVDGEVYIL